MSFQPGRTSSRAEPCLPLTTASPLRNTKSSPFLTPRAHTIKPLESIIKPRIVQLGLTRVSTSRRFCSVASADRSGVVVLWDLVDGEVLRVDGGAELGLEGGADAAKGCPVDAAEETVLFDFCGAADGAETVVCIVDESGLKRLQLASGTSSV